MRGGVELDTVFYADDLTAEDVLRACNDHDGMGATHVAEENENV